MKRPLRSVLIGDVDFYPSEFVFGVAQGMAMLGHWHATVNVRQPLDVIARRLDVVRPDVIWAHMLLWSPQGPAHSEGLLELCAARRRTGARVLIHDGDARETPRWPHDVSAAVDLALCNHLADRSAWKVRQVRWPYFAFVQSRIADPVPEFACDLAFAGRLAGGIYEHRTVVVDRCAQALGERFKLFPSASVPHTLFRTPELAASAAAVLGYGRPEAAGWCDVRVFQYPGAGGVLIHDDVQGYLEPGRHYVPIARDPSPVEIEETVREAKRLGPAIREEAFRYVQSAHTSGHRVYQALREVGFSFPEMAGA